MAYELENTVTKLEKEVADLTQRLGELAAKFEEVREARGIVGKQGVRGPAGPIEAAVLNAEIKAGEVANAKIADFTKREVAPFDAKVSSLKEQFQQTKDYIDASIENAVVAAVIKTLVEYQVLEAETLNLNPHAVAYAMSRIENGLVKK
jgi:hypothetical protein